ncbi:hypothetical protein BH09BAC1_BH09BAC1_12230 [soil metagenome]
MKTTLILFCIAFMGAITHTAPAQTASKTPAETRAQKETDKLAKELGVDALQKEKLYLSNLDYEKEVEKLGNSVLTKEQQDAKKSILRQKQLAHLKDVLNPVQYEKMAAKWGAKKVKVPKL